MIGRRGQYFGATIIIVIVFIVLCLFFLNQKTITEPSTITTIEYTTTTISYDVIEIQNGNELKLTCCYPNECPESKNNPEECNCMYLVDCITLTTTTRKATTTTRFEILPTETKTPAMPNSYLTPGEVMETNLAVICEKGYAQSVRYVPESEKAYIYAVYGIRTHKPNEFNIEHLIPLCLGGSNGVKNLWPAPYVSARMKARLDTRICNIVCKGEIGLTDAQTRIRTDWYKLYLEMNLNNS